MNDIKRDVIDKLTPELIAEMQHIWFTADLHQGHPKIINICNRPVYIPNLAQIEDMNSFEYKRIINKFHDEWLVKEVVNKYVGNKDEFYILGDLSLAKRVYAEKFIDRLNGNKHLILGNHDQNIKNSTRFSEITQIKNFSFSRRGLNIHIALSHFPMASWDRKVHGSWHLYGHVHDRFANLKPDAVELMGLSMDVGIDARTEYWCRPINLYEVVLEMYKKSETLPKYNEFKNLPGEGNGKEI